MREWPSLVPGAPEGYYIVINRYGRFGTAFAETNLDRADYETTIADLIAGQHSDPLRVVRFNPDADQRGRFARRRGKYCAASTSRGRKLPSELKGFIDRHVGRDAN